MVCGLFVVGLLFVDHLPDESLSSNDCHQLLEPQAADQPLL
jgi:hypothetical protein